MLIKDKLNGILLNRKEVKTIMDNNSVKEKKHSGTEVFRAYYILIICTLLYIINHMDRQVFAVVLQPMKLELGLTDAECGLIQTIFILCIAFFSFPIAYLMDRWNRKNLIALIAIIWSVFTFITGLMKNFIGLALARAGVGTGEAAYTAGGVSIVSAAFPESSRGKALGIFYAGLPIGAAIGTILGGYISTSYGWRTPFYYFAIPGIILAVMAFFIKDYSVAGLKTDSSKPVSFLNTITYLWKIPTLRWFYLGLGLTHVMITSFMGWAPALVMRELNVSEASAGLIVGGIGLMALIGAPVGGFLSDYFYKRDVRGRMVLIASSICAAGLMLIIVILMRFSTIGIILAMIFGIFMVAPSASYGAVSQELVLPSYKNASAGMMLFMSFLLGGAWAPYAAGVVSDGLGGGADGLRIAMIIMASIGILGGLCFFVATRPYIRDATAATE